MDAGDFLLSLGAPKPELPFEYLPGVFKREPRGIKWETRSTYLYGRTVEIPRMLAMYGQAYTYSGISHPACAFPPELEEVRQRVEALTGRTFNSVLCNLYRNGEDSVSWHSDDDYECGDQSWVASVSFGSTRRFKVRRKMSREGHDFELEHGSLLLMKDRAQLDWQHCVPKTKQPVGPRINFTFRHIER